MGTLRYVLVIALVSALALLTVSEHVKRTKIGYELRTLDKERVRLREVKKAAQLDYERAVVPERLRERAAELEIASPTELTALAGPSLPSPKR